MFTFQTPMYLRAEQKFVWNEYLLAELGKTPSVANFCLPIIHGFVSITSCALNGEYEGIVFDY